MIDIELLNDICTIPGAPGFEQRIRERIIREVTPYADELTIDNMGNVYAIRKGKENKRYLVMSTSAHQSLTKAQIHKIEEHCEIISSSLDTIEACGGGSARCMMAEVFLPRE